MRKRSNTKECQKTSLNGVFALNSLSNRPCPKQWSGIIIRHWALMFLATYIKPYDQAIETILSPAVHFCSDLRAVCVRLWYVCNIATGGLNHSFSWHFIFRIVLFVSIITTSPPLPVAKSTSTIFDGQPIDSISHPGDVRQHNHQQLLRLILRASKEESHSTCWYSSTTLQSIGRRGAKGD